MSVEELIFDLLDKPEVQIEGGARGAVGVAITNLFENSRRVIFLVCTRCKYFIRPIVL